MWTRAWQLSKHLPAHMCESHSIPQSPNLLTLPQNTCCSETIEKCTSTGELLQIAHETTERRIQRLHMLQTIICDDSKLQNHHFTHTLEQLAFRSISRKRHFCIYILSFKKFWSWPNTNRHFCKQNVQTFCHLQNTAIHLRTHVSKKLANSVTYFHLAAPITRSMKDDTTVQDLLKNGH